MNPKSFLLVGKYSCGSALVHEPDCARKKPKCSCANDTCTCIYTIDPKTTFKGKGKYFNSDCDYTCNCGHPPISTVTKTYTNYVNQVSSSLISGMAGYAQRLKNDIRGNGIAQLSMLGGMTGGA